MAREYDSAVGRYVEPDPVGLDGGGYSTYSYVFDDPLDFVDADGLMGRAPGTAFPRPPIPFPSKNTSLCTYYDQVARQNGCKYHGFAAGVCRGQNFGVNVLTSPLSVSTVNCIRSCLINSDK